MKTGDARTTAGDEDAVDLGDVALAETGGYATAAAPENAAQAPRSTPAKYEAVPLPADAGPKSLSRRAPPTRPVPPGAGCSTTRPALQDGSENVQVEVWDQDSSAADDLLTTAVTGGNGIYNICFESTDGEGRRPGGLRQVHHGRTRCGACATRPRATPTTCGRPGVIAIADPGTANFGSCSRPTAHSTALCTPSTG